MRSTSRAANNTAVLVSHQWYMEAAHVTLQLCLQSATRSISSRQCPAWLQHKFAPASPRRCTCRSHMYRQQFTIMGNNRIWTSAAWRASGDAPHYASHSQCGCQVVPAATKGSQQPAAESVTATRVSEHGPTQDDDTWKLWGRKQCSSDVGRDG